MRKFLIVFIVFLFMPLTNNVVNAVEAPSYKGKQSIYLTFDDGPNIYTPKVLDVLKQENVKATFFVTGKNAQKNKKILKRIAREGHTIGLHSMSHDAKIFYRNPKTAVHEMKKTQTIVEKITGIKSNTIRVPYGSIPFMTAEFRQAMNQVGFKMWDWNVDSEDWCKPRKNKKTVQMVKKEIGMNENKNLASIILMHDHAIHLQSLKKIIIEQKKQQKEFQTTAGKKIPYNFYHKWDS